MSYGGEMVPAGPGGYGSPPRGAPPNDPGGFPVVYQIDFSAVASGKRIATTKRRIRWRFGFTNQEALRNGETGTACRGEEHDVTIIWSITSGKRQITMDGKEVHFSVNRGSLLDFSWSVRGNHVLKVIAHASPPLSATPGFRQYELLVDGQSFFRMPKVYELGVRGGHPSMSPRSPPGDGYSNYDLPRGGGSHYGRDSLAEQEDADLKRAIAASLEESRRHLSDRGRMESEPPQQNGAPPPAPAADLLDFSSEPPAPAALPPPAPAPVVPPPAPVAALPMAPSADSQSLVSYQTEARPPYPGAPGAAAAFMSPDASSFASAPPTYTNYGGAPPAQPPQQQYAPQPPQPAPPTTQYAPQPPAPPATQYAPQPPAAPVQYAPAPAPPTQYAADQFAPPLNDDPFAPKPPPPPTHNDIANSILGKYETPQQNGQPGAFQSPIASGAPAELPPQQEPGQAPQLSMNAAYEEPEEKPKSDVDEALSKLVNFDDISEPAPQEVKLTMQKEEEKKKKSRTGAVPPAATGWVGSNATLSQIKEVKPAKPVKDPSEIMKPPPMLFSPGAVNAGALVVHGEGPPPLQRGFGVGAQMGYGGMPQQQQPPPQAYYGQQQQPPPPPPQQQQYY